MRDKRQSRKVLLLGNDDRVTLAIARSLGRRDIAVDVAWHKPTSPALASRYIGAAHQLPPYAPHSDDWRRSLEALIADRRYDLVIPVNDFAMVPLQHERRSIDPDAPIYLINDNAFAAGFDKSATIAVARSVDMPLPDTIICADWPNSGAAELQNKLSTMPAPYYLKPRTSVAKDAPGEKRSVRRVQSAGEIRRHVDNETYKDGFIVQGHVDGVGVGLEFLARSGDILMAMMHRRLRETIDGGSSYRETMMLEPRILEASRRFIRSLDYTGVGMLEFRYDEKSGAWALIEFNCRFWGSLPLAVAAGVDFPFALYKLLVDAEPPDNVAYPSGVRCRNILTDLRAHRRSPPPRASFEWGRLLTGADHLDFFARDDWRPFAASLGGYVKRKIAGRDK